MFIFSPIYYITLCVYWLISCVGDSIIAYVCYYYSFITYNVPIQNAPVFPVPDYAYAIVSFFWIIGNIAIYYIYDGV